MESVEKGKASLLSGIKADVRAEERQIIEAHYLEELSKLRKAKDSERDQLEKELNIRFDRDKKQLIARFAEQIRDLKVSLDEKDRQLKNSQKAWEKYKAYAYKFYRFSEQIAQKSKMALDSNAEIFQIFNKIHNQLDVVNRFNNKHSEEIEKLLSLDEVEKST